MRSSIVIFATYIALTLGVTPGLFAQELKRLSYNNPGLVVDLGVGLWAWPLPMDYNDDGLTDLLVVCTDTPYNGVYYFENSGVIDEETDLPIFKPSIRLGKAVDNASISYIQDKAVITTPQKTYPDFKNSLFEHPEKILSSDIKELYPEGVYIRANQWKFIDFNGDDLLDILVGVGVWGDYGWDDAYDANGKWTNGPLHGYIYLIENIGSNENPNYIDPVQLCNTDGIPLDVFGRPSPNFADFNGDGKPDLLCGEFRDGFTFFENVGSLYNPLFAPGRPLTNGDQIIRMDLCMITPVAFDFTGDGWLDIVVGDEDGRVALVEHTGDVVDGMPLFLPPRYFKQQADEIKFGALATPVGFDWNGDGKDDILCGNTAGQIAFIENLGGDPVRWVAPRLLEADGEVIRIQAGVNGSIQGPAEAKWGYTTLSVADWNHDGLPDVIVNSIWGKVIWYENIGTRHHPKLTKAQPITVEWKGKAPKPSWNWWDPMGKELVTQWRTTPVAVDWTGDGLTDLVMLDHEGYLALYRREKRDGKLILLPGERIFRLEGEDTPWRLNEGRAGASGRRKLAIVDFDRDGRLDILLNSRNASFFKNMGQENDTTIFRDMGLLDERKLAGHTSSPSVINLSDDDYPTLIIGAEDGYIYFKENPFRK
ncbi:MAG TPA: VCBS repeat-containing protein [Bacteroidales bacterium]|nr:VCBS repeat-containing protein [Bacteroidales bacterium]